MILMLPVFILQVKENVLYTSKFLCLNTGNTSYSCSYCTDNDDLTLSGVQMSCQMIISVP